jgi:glycosyltransferase A (GT-A) superfamily protein (DUF2064 family)
MAHLHNQFTLAVAIFVKTPGRSPLKTRLAKTVETDAAHKFYLLACKAIAQTLRKAQNESTGAIQPIWAVAEDDADEYWPEFPIIHQGSGELGDKLHHVYSDLLSRYNSVALIGADAPQISTSDLVLVRDTLSSGQDFVVGPASDGGFYLFAGKKPVEKEIWLRTPYSQTDTLEILQSKVSRIGSIAKLHRYTDVDIFENLHDFLNEIKNAQQVTDEQKDLIKHCKAMLAKT